MNLKGYRAYIAAVAISAIAVYIPTVSGGFGWDEFNVLFGSSYFIPSPEFDFKRPLFRALLLLQRSVFGDSAVYYHVINLLIHAVNASLVFVIARRLLGGATPALISALVFALHPVNSEAVAWVMGGSELLKTFLMLVSLQVYLMYKEDGKLTALIASAMFFLLACLAGQGALILPLAILAYEIMLGGGIKGFKLPAAAYGVAAAAYLIAFRGAGEIIASDMYSFGRVFDSLAAMGYYISKLLIPVGLSFMPVLIGENIYIMFALAVLVMGVMFRSEKRKLEFFFLFLVLIMMLPALTYILAEPKNFIGFRHIYATSAMFAMFMGLMLSRVPGRRMMTALVVVVALVYAGLVLGRVNVWDDRTAVWAESYKNNPADEVRNINYVAALIHADRVDEGKLILKRALALQGISSDGFQRMMEMLYDISPNSDNEMYDLLVEVKGPSKANLGMGFMFYSKYSNGGRKDAGLLTQAIRYLERSVKAETGLIMAKFYLGVAYLEAGQFDKCIEELMAVKSMDPTGKYANEADNYLNMALQFKDAYSKQLNIELK